VCDIYIKDLNLIIEYYGDYWHCNPKKYDENYLHPHKKKFAKQIWMEDSIRIDYIKNLGYNLEVIWECDLDKPNNLKTILEK
jgi:G:T-mismatch repair DNA endonuclease (very short patch repair protein)